MKKADYLNRLKALADYLKKGNLKCEIIAPPKNVRFVHNENEEPEVEVPIFGFALQDLPLIFEEWGYSPEGYPILKDRTELLIMDSAEKFFLLSDVEFMALFVPGRQIPNAYGGKKLNTNAQPIDIANNMFEFIKRKKTIN